MTNTEKAFLELINKPVRTKADLEELERLGKIRMEELRTEAGLLILQLNEVGIFCKSLWDLVNTNESYPAAIPILIEHLPKKYHFDNKEAIIRSLMVKEAKGKVLPALIAELEAASLSDESLLWVLGYAISYHCKKSDHSLVVSLAKNRKYKRGRERLVEWLYRNKSEETEEILIQIIEEGDKFLILPFIILLGKLKSTKCINVLENLSFHPDSDIKQSASKMLKKIKS